MANDLLIFCHKIKKQADALICQYWNDYASPRLNVKTKPPLNFHALIFMPNKIIASFFAPKQPAGKAIERLPFK